MLNKGQCAFSGTMIHCLMKDYTKLLAWPAELLLNLCLMRKITYTMNKCR